MYFDLHCIPNNATAGIATKYALRHLLLCRQGATELEGGGHQGSEIRDPARRAVARQGSQGTAPGGWHARWWRTASAVRPHGLYDWECGCAGEVALYWGVIVQYKTWGMYTFIWCHIASLRIHKIPNSVLTGS
jgi:hypothetical protein